MYLYSYFTVPCSIFTIDSLIGQQTCQKACVRLSCRDMNGREQLCLPKFRLGKIQGSAGDKQRMVPSNREIVYPTCTWLRFTEFVLPVYRAAGIAADSSYNALTSLGFKSLMSNLPSPVIAYIYILSFGKHPKWLTSEVQSKGIAKSGLSKVPLSHLCYPKWHNLQ